MITPKTSFLLCSLALLIAVPAWAGTSVTVTSDSLKSKETATRDDNGGLKPKDFEAKNVLGDEDSLDVCYTGKAEKVKEVLENIADQTDHWELKKFSTYSPYKGDDDWVKATFLNKNSDQEIYTVIHPCR
jgi:hypothetical protein